MESFTHPISGSIPQSSRQSIKSSAAGFELHVATRTVSKAKIKTPTSNEVSRIVDTALMPKNIPLAGSELQNLPIDPASEKYRNGLLVIGFITLLFASNSPALHSAFELASSTPPVLLVNAIVSFVGLTGVVAGSPLLEKIVPDPSAQSANTDATIYAADEPAPLSFSSNALMRVVGPSAVAGFELGLWKFLGTTANIYGLSQTSSDHGAFLIQLTTLIVPVAQGLMGVPIPSRIWSAIGLALGGVFMFTQDPSQRDCATLTGDGLCALAAIFYATYDLRLFKWGKIIPTNELITTKMMTQSLLSLGLLFVLGWDETRTFLSEASMTDLQLVGAVSLWSGFAVNALAPYLQVSGQQAVGPARAQILYASQPLWAAIMSYFFLSEQVGSEGFVGGIAFLSAMFLAATAENPDPDCGKRDCEV